MINFSRYLHRASGLARVLPLRNVRSGERWVSLLAGAGLAALALRRWRSQSVALAASGLLLRRALTGKCPVYRRLGISSS
jgi:uncharacterized membrane protein